MNNLYKASSNKFGQQVVKAEYHEKPLQGGTLGNVRLISGVAETNGGEKLPFDVVQKKQVKWERDGDSLSWRREYDLYKAGIENLLDENLHIPACYLAKINRDETEIELWIEYICGVSGAELSVTLLEKAAYC
jgi:hypothetical protein